MRTPFGSPQQVLTGLRLLAAAAVLAPVRPDRAATFPLAYVRYRLTPATAYAIGARRHPHRLAVVDDRGTLTFAEIHRRTDRLARAFVDRGLPGEGRLGLLCRNHRTPVEVLIARRRPASTWCCSTRASPRNRSPRRSGSRASPRWWPTTTSSTVWSTCPTPSPASGDGP